MLEVGKFGDKDELVQSRTDDIKLNYTGGNEKMRVSSNG
jgi:hypothetical protein